VADIGHLRSFDKTTGAKKEDVDMTQLKAKSLSGLAASSDGRIFITDTIGHSIFVVNPDQGNKAEIFASGKGVESPTGIVFDPKTSKFYVNMGLGTLATVDLEGKVQKLLKLPVKSPTGIGLDDDGNIYFSSFNRNVIYKVDKNLKSKVVASGIMSPYNISLDKAKRLILVPLFLKHKVYTIAY
jgi:DNA-binding beta-propeller fold protein YncE